MGDHSESIQIDFDPTIVTYSDLLDAFWHGHNPTHPAWSRQYMSAIFHHTEAQEAAAMESAALEADQRGKEIHTALVPARRFYLAEDYHQKYALRHHREISNEFLAIYPTLEAFVNSTAVTRANGFASGYGSFAFLQSEVSRYGLSETARQKLIEIASRYNK
jgi:peptide-methionine (S)-S-oxide reductase